MTRYNPKHRVYCVKALLVIVMNQSFDRGLGKDAAKGATFTNFKAILGEDIFLSVGVRLVVVLSDGYVSITLNTSAWFPEETVPKN